MPKKKVKAAVKETTATITNNVDQVATTAKSINTQVVDTVNELIEDTKQNGTQVAEAAATALKNIQITGSLKKISTTAVNINAEILETATEVLEDIYQSTKNAIGAIDIKVELDIAKNIEKLQKATKNTNDFMADTAEVMVKDTVENVEKWQALLTKTLGHGTTLLGKQQEQVLDTTEALIEQYKTGSVRLKKLLGINFTPNTTYFKGQADKAVSLVKEAKDKAVASVDELLDGAFDKIKGMADLQNKTAKVKKVASEVIAVAEEAIVEVAESVTIPVTKTTKKTKGAKSVAKAKKTTKKASTPSITPKATTTPKTKATKTTKVAATAKASKKGATTTKVAATAKAKIAKAAKAAPKAKVAKAAKVVAAATTNSTGKDDLKLVEGIGPKIEELLNKAGITTFQQLATTEAAAVKEILLAAGNRYKMHDPTTWAKQAELAAAGKWEVLTVWKSRLKGGKASNQVSRIVTL